MNNVSKQAQLQAYITARAIDYCFLQEGFAGNIGASCINTSESHGASNQFTLPGAPTVDSEKILRAAYKPSTIIQSLGGMASNDTYNVIYPSGTLPVPVAAEPDYVNNAGVRNFVLGPASAAATMLEKIKKPPVQKYKASLHGANYTFDYFAYIKEDIADEIKSPTQRCVNLLGYRRPKSVSVTYNGNPLSIYFWHAPIGGQTTLADLGLSVVPYAAVAQQGSGGQLEVAANILFAKYLGLTTASTDMTADTMLIGDLNIKPPAVTAIYGNTSSIESSLDTLCHVIAPSAIALTRVHSGDFVHRNNQYECTDALYPLLTSDHAPVIVDI
jgi:hypothetical protein